MRASRDARRRGFILPTTLLVMTLVTVMLAAAFVLVSAEYRVTDNSFASSRALAIAQAGMQSYLAGPHDFRSGSQDTTYRFGTDSAKLRARRLRDSTAVAPQLWVVQVTGYDGRKSSGGQPSAIRAIAQFATLNPGSLPIRATLVAANGVRMFGNGNNPNPIDTADVAVCDTILGRRGLTVPSGGYSDSSASGTRSPPGGGVEYLASEGATIDSTHVDWAKLLAGQFTPDYVATPPCLNSRQTSSNPFSAGFCDGNASIDGTHRYGLLVVTGNLSIANSTHWDGILIVGGRLITPSSPSASWKLDGQVITGLNGGVLPNSIRRGSGRLTFSSCHTGRTVRSLSSLEPVKNAWVDNWSTY